MGIIIKKENNIVLLNKKCPHRVLNEKMFKKYLKIIRRFKG